MYLFLFSEAQAVIKEGTDLHVHEGSPLQLHCKIENATQKPTYLFWFHNSTMVNYESNNRPSLHITEHNYSSILLISNVTKSDAGTYRCEPGLAVSDNITIHVHSSKYSFRIEILCYYRINHL